MKKALIATLLASVLWLSACTVPSWVVTAEGIAEAAVPIAGSVVDIIDPALAPLVTLIEGGFSAVDGTLKTYQATPTATNLQAAEAALAALQANEVALEKAGGTTAAQDATINGILALIAQAITQIAAQIPAATAGVTLRAGAKSNGWTGKNFTNAYNAITAGDARFHKL